MSVPRYLGRSPQGQAAANYADQLQQQIALARMRFQQAAAARAAQKQEAGLNLDMFNLDQLAQPRGMQTPQSRARDMLRF